MSEQKSRTRKLTAAIGAMALTLGATGAVATASVPADDGTIRGCYVTKGGQRRVLATDAEQCRSTETALEWNKQGPPGPVGPAGPQGDPGPAGPPGAGLAATLQFGTMWAYAPSDCNINADAHSKTEDDSVTVTLDPGTYLPVSSRRSNLPSFGGDSDSTAGADHGSSFGEMQVLAGDRELSNWYESRGGSLHNDFKIFTLTEQTDVHVHAVVAAFRCANASFFPGEVSFIELG